MPRRELRSKSPAARGNGDAGGTLTDTGSEGSAGIGAGGYGRSPGNVGFTGGSGFAFNGSAAQAAGLRQYGNLGWGAFMDKNGGHA